MPISFSLCVWHRIYGTEKKGENMKFDRENRIQQIRDCGQSIMDKAETIYGDYECPADLQIIIKVKINEIPTIEVRREFYSKTMIDNL